MPERFGNLRDYACGKASGLLSTPGSLKPIAELGVRLAGVKKVKSAIPEKFDAVKVTEREKLYNKI